MQDGLGVAITANLRGVNITARRKTSEFQLRD
jgi:hypothetical protein